MKASKRSLIRAGVLGVVLATLLGMVRVQVEKDRCSACFTHRSVAQWRWGPSEAWSIALGPRRVTLAPSLALTGFFPASHVHEWVPRPKYCVSGFLCLYESDPGFRAFVDGKLARGEVTAEELQVLTPERAGAPRLDPIVVEYYEGQGDSTAAAAPLSVSER